MVHRTTEGYVTQDGKTTNDRVGYDKWGIVKNMMIMNKKTTKAR